MNDSTTPEKESTRKVMLDALEAESPEEQSIGKPETPVMPLYGSENVPVSPQEEHLYA